MKISRIEINGYKILKQNLVEMNDFQLFPQGSQILGLIGSNGSGKTTFCSMIARVFQSISTRSKLEFDISIEFEYKSSKRVLKCVDNYVWLAVDGETIYDFKLGSRLKYEDKIIHNERVISFWNGKFILSTFETCGEYPNEKPSNYLGDDPILKYDVASIYGKNIFGYPSITEGIIRFLKSDEKQSIAGSFLERMGFRLSGEVDIKIVRSITDGYWDSSLESAESILYKKIKNDNRLEFTSEPQILDTPTTLEICKDYSGYIGKQIFLNGFRLIKEDVDLGFDDLSSGEKFLIIRYISILSGIENDSIIVVEEPENHLNPKWRELVIPALHKVATAYNSILIFTTHDYRIIRYLHNDCVLNVTNGVINKIDTQILLCDEYDFEAIGEKTISFIYSDLIEVYHKLNRFEKAQLINSMCNVEEKMKLRKTYLTDDETH
ncbi:AAA family ATPase [Labilibaculum antarcticum]|nr:AAA family ATPase [Labilibaculum antarcticum]